MGVSVSAQDGIAVVTIDNPPVNATSQQVRAGLMDALRQTEADSSVSAVVLECAGRTFVAGADVSEFGAPPVAPHLPDVINAIESASKPWVAKLHGTVLGGGLELAMGCHARVAAQDTKLGLPEVTLGLIPGAGGTVRLPRLVPAVLALEMISGGKPITAARALDAGLIDEMPEGDLLKAAINLATRSSPTGTLTLDLRAYDLAAYNKFRDKTLTKARSQQSPKEAVVAVDRALTLPPRDALAAERAAFLTLKDSDQSVALRHIFFAERKTLRDPRCKGTARAFDNVGVVGGGTMGAGIATACLLRGLRVQLVETSHARAETARDTITRNLEASAKRGLIKDPSTLLASLATGAGNDLLSGSDLVIEAVFEDMTVKKDVLRQVEAVTRSDAVLATNTSYLDVNEIAGSLQDPSRVIGLHFFSPAHIMKLLEIVVPDGVAADVVATAAQFGKRLGKIGVLAGVCDGFIGNRIMSAYRHEADVLLMEGAMPQHVDAAMRDYGFAIGICEMQDLAGLDIAWAMRKRRAAEHGLPDNYVPIADRLCEAGRFGRKTGAGWYDYDGTQATPSDVVADVIADTRAAKNIHPRVFAADELMNRILTRMRSEADAVLSEGIAQCAADIDVVMVNGYGFPRWRGGPFGKKL